MERVKIVEPWEPSTGEEVFWPVTRNGLNYETTWAAESGRVVSASKTVVAVFIPLDRDGYLAGEQPIRFIGREHVFQSGDEARKYGKDNNVYTVGD